MPILPWNFGYMAGSQLLARTPCAVRIRLPYVLALGNRLGEINIHAYFPKIGFAVTQAIHLQGERFTVKGVRGTVTTIRFSF